MTESPCTILICATGPPARPAGLCPGINTVIREVIHPCTPTPTTSCYPQHYIRLAARPGPVVHLRRPQRNLHPSPPVPRAPRGPRRPTPAPPGCRYLASNTASAGRTNDRTGGDTLAGHLFITPPLQILFWTRLDPTTVLRIHNDAGRSTPRLTLTTRTRNIPG